MMFMRLEIDFWFVVGVLLIGELSALAFFFYLKRSKLRSQDVSANTISNAMPETTYRQAVAEEMERLRAGGELNEALVRKMSAEERALFEITLIDALTKWPREDQHRIRLALIKCGYDELCARRVMREEVSDRVRASTLLRLLRPQSQGNTGGLDTQMLNPASSGEDGEENTRRFKSKAKG